MKATANFVVAGVFLLLSIALPVYAQIERWVFRYNGPADSADCAIPVVYGADGNIYVAGYSQGVGTGRDFIVISLNKDTGDTNWVYRYNGPADSGDVANSLVYGDDGNLYAAGYSRGSGTGSDWTVISLTTAGAERWVYRYNGPLDSDDVANSIVYGNNGNLYVTGNSDGRFTIISLTDSGGERWVYRYVGPNDDRGAGYSIVYGTDGNVYAAGFLWDTIINPPYYDKEFAVVSVTSSGSERWVYRNWTGDYCEAYSIVYGGDGNIYCAGKIRTFISCFSVVSLTPSGDERWVYTLPSGNSDAEGSAYSVVYGLDGNIYAAGVNDTSDSPLIINPDFTVVSLTTSGGERWVYRYDGGYLDRANMIVCGADSNLYIAGMSFQGTRAFAVISVTLTGGERWVYWYNGPGPDDAALSLVCGNDGNIYATGYSDDGTGGAPIKVKDLLVISLNPTGAVAEHRSQTISKRIAISTSTFQRRNLEFSLSLSTPDNISLSLYSITGEKIFFWQVSAPMGVSQYKKDLGSLSAGTYILRVETDDKRYAETKKLIVLK